MLHLQTITKDKILNYIKWTFTIVSCFVLIYIPLVAHKSDYDKGYADGYAKGCATISNSQTAPSISTELEVSTKASSTEPDLTLNNTYTAVINGSKVEVPIVDKNIKESLKSSTDSVTGTSVAAKVEQTIDLTPIFQNYEPKHSWEFGVGVGCLDNKVYVPIDIQRNFSYNKALELQLNVRDKEIDGATLSYKIRI